MKKRARRGKKLVKGKRGLAKREQRIEKYLGISKNYRDTVRMVPLSLAFTSTPWPRKMRTQMKTVTSSTTGDQTGYTAYTWYLNSFGNGTTVTHQGCGPQVNFAGNFTTNYPAGLKGIIQTPDPSGNAICPYNLYRIRRAKIYVDVIPDAITAGEVSSGELRVAIFPSVQPSFSGTSFTSICEQPYCKFKTIANPIFGTATTTAASGGGTLSGASRVRLSAFGAVGRLFGVPPSAIDNNDDYRGTYNAVTPNQAFFHVVVIGDGNHYNANVEATIVYDTEFYGLNNLSSAQNN